MKFEISPFNAWVSADNTCTGRQYSYRSHTHEQNRKSNTHIPHLAENKGKNIYVNHSLTLLSLLASRTERMNQEPPSFHRVRNRCLLHLFARWSVLFVSRRGRKNRVQLILCVGRCRKIPRLFAPFSRLNSD